MFRNIYKITGILVAILLLYFFISKNSYLLNVIRYGNVNIDDYKIFFNDTLPNKNVFPWEIDKNYNQKAIPPHYMKWMEYYQTTAFVIIKNNKILHESYYRGYDSNSISNSFSMAKSIVSLLIGIAIDEGYIKSADDPVYKYFPPFNNAQNKHLTIKHLLTMSSGLNWEESYNSPFSLTTQAYYGDQLYLLVSNLKVVEEPGKEFKYLSCNTQILAYVLENATGKSLSDYAAEKLWQPLGANHFALWSCDKPGGDEKAYCCFYATATDFARIGQLILHSGKWNNRQIVSEKYISEATTPASWLMKDGKPLNDYGYQFWRMKYQLCDVIYARGILGQYIFIIPQKNIIIVRLGERKSQLKVSDIPCDVYIWLNLAQYLSE